MSHKHVYAMVPIHPDSMLQSPGCVTCGRRLEPKLVDGALICPSCKATLPGWRTDFAGHWQGIHECGFVYLPTKGWVPA